MIRPRSLLSLAPAALIAAASMFITPVQAQVSAAPAEDYCSQNPGKCEEAKARCATDAAACKKLEQMKALPAAAEHGAPQIPTKVK